MKSVFIILLFFASSLQAQVKTFWVSNDGDGISPGTRSNPISWQAWHTTAVQNSVNVGDTVRFLANNKYSLWNAPFNGAKSYLRLPKSGMIVDSFGTGTKPVVHGWLELAKTQLTQSSFNTNVWEYSLPITASLYTVIVQIKRSGQTEWATGLPGRWPNRPTYYNVALASDSVARKIQVSGLIGAPNFAGGEFVHRVNNSEYRKTPVSWNNSSTGTLTLTADAALTTGWGFFIDKHYNVLDTATEFTYMASTGKVYVYGLQNGDSIRVNGIARLTDLNNLNNIKILNTDFEGAHEYGVYLGYSDSDSISNSRIRYAPEAVRASTTNYTTISNCIIEDIAGPAIVLNGNSEGNVIKNNIIKRIGIIPGFGSSLSGFNQGSGITVTGKPGSKNSIVGNTIENNRIDSVGGGGMHVFGTNMLASKNIIGNTNMVLDDMGALSIQVGFINGISDTNSLYTNPPTNFRTENWRVTKNIIKGGQAWALEGKPITLSVHLLYPDDMANGGKIDSNTIYNSPGEGIYLHGPHLMEVSNNTSFNNKSDALLIVQEKRRINYLETYGMNVTDNTLFATSNTTNNWVTQYFGYDTAITKWGTFNRNRFIRNDQLPQLRVRNTLDGVNSVFQQAETGVTLSGATNNGTYITINTGGYAEWDVPFYENNFFLIQLKRWVTGSAANVNISIDGTQVLSGSVSVGGASNGFVYQNMSNVYNILKGVRKVRLTVTSGTLNLDEVQFAYDFNLTFAKFRSYFPAYEAQGSIGPTNVSSAFSDIFFYVNESDTTAVIAAPWYTKSVDDAKVAPSDIIVKPRQSVILVKRSDVVSDVTAPVPGNSGVVSATSGTGSITLSWTAAGDASAVTYDVYSVTAETGNSKTEVKKKGTLLANTGSTTYTATGLSNGPLYSYAVIAKDTDGNESFYSQAAAKTISGTQKVARTPGGKIIITKGKNVISIK